MRRTVLCSIGLLGGICLVETPAQALAQGPCVNDTLISRPRDCDGNTEDRHFIGRFGPLAPGWNSETDSGIEPIRIPRVQLAPGEELLIRRDLRPPAC